MQDRIPRNPGRVKLTPLGNNLYDMERADNPQQVGTPLNKANLFDSSNETRYGATTPNGALSNLVREWNVTVTVSGWVEGTEYSTQRINCVGMNANYNPIYAVKTTSLATYEAESGGFGNILTVTLFSKR